MSFKQGFAEALVLAKRLPKTVTVAVWRKHLNKKYKVLRTVKSTFMVHDELDECVPGDRVIIKQCRPISKLKRFMVYDIIKKYEPAEFLRKHPEFLSTKTEGTEVNPAIPPKQRRKIGEGPQQTVAEKNAQTT